MSKHTLGVLYAVNTAMFWGVLAIALKIAVSRVDPATIVWFRFSMAFVPLFIWVSLRERRQLKIIVRPPWLLILAAIMLSLNYLGYNYGVQFTSPGNAQIFIQTSQILLALAGIAFFKEKFTGIQSAGFVLAILGLLLFYNQQLSHFSENQLDYKKGILLTILAAVAWAVYAILQKKLVIRYSGASLNLFLFGLPSILYLPLVNFHQLASLDLWWWALMVFLGINTLVSYTTLAMSLKYLEASKISIILIMNPVVTFLLMSLLGAVRFSLIHPEKFTVLSVTGAFVVLTGALLVIWKPKT